MITMVNQLHPKIVTTMHPGFNHDVDDNNDIDPGFNHDVIHNNDPAKHQAEDNDMDSMAMSNKTV